MDCGCKDCKERFVGCHSTCEKYNAFLKENERLKELKRQDQMKSILPAKSNKREKKWKW